MAVPPQLDRSPDYFRTGPFYSKILIKVVICGDSNPSDCYVIVRLISIWPGDWLVPGDMPQLWAWQLCVPGGLNDRRVAVVQMTPRIIGNPSRKTTDKDCLEERERE